MAKLEAPAKAEKKGTNIVITLPIEELRPAKKTELVASTHGSKQTNILIDDRLLVINVNCYVYKNK